MKVNQNNIRVLLNKEVYNEKELKYLKALLLHCNDIYYNTEEDSPLSDADYDLLFKRYNKNSKEKLSSLTPAKQGKRLVNVLHDYPELVGTLEKITNKDELKEWLTKKFKDLNLSKTDKVSMTYSHKEDGNSLCITFNEDGTIKSALTRGKEGQGADMTSLFKKLKLKLPTKTLYEFGVKFEAVMTDENFNKYNEEYEKLNNRTLSSNRSAVAGILGNDEGHKFIKYVSLVPLTVKIKDTDINKEKQIKVLESFSKQDKMILPYQYNVTDGTLDEIYKTISKYYDKMSNERIKLNKPIDGLVIEFNDTNIRKKLGREDDHNNFDVALKFPALAKHSKVTDISFYYGRSGK